MSYAKIMSSMLSLCAVLFATIAHAEDKVEYKDETGTMLEGLHVPSECLNSKATVLIAHQWMGITEHEKNRGHMLAKECYDVFLVDVYGKGVKPKNTDEAKALTMKYKDDPELARSRMRAGLAAALKISKAPEKVFVYGYCFGGTMALELARDGANVMGVIAFHGGLATKAPAKENAIKANIMVHHGADDPFVPAADVAAFQQEMAKAEAQLSFFQYPHAVHAFTQKEAGNDPSKGMAYNEVADKVSWMRTLRYLDRMTAPKPSGTL